MLTQLHIANLVLIRDETVEFDRGLTVITGETGAGKSVLIGAIELLLGDRADDDLIRTGENEALIEGLFEVPDKHPARETLREMGLEADGNELIVRRRIVRGGKSRCHVNQSPVTVAQLREIGERLINIHGQNEHQLLLSARHQLEILDSFAGNGQTLEQYAKTFAAHRHTRENREKLAAALRQSADREEYLKFQIAEIEQAGLVDENEEEALLALKNRMENAQTLLETLREVTALMDAEETGALSRLGAARKRLDTLARIDAAFSSEHTQTIDEASARLRETLARIEGYCEGLDLDEEHYRKVDERCEAIRRLKKKHGADVAEILKKLDEYRAELANITGGDESLGKLEKEETRLGGELETLRGKIHIKRLEAAKTLSARVQSELKDLGNEYAKFEVRVEEGGPGDGAVPGQAAFFLSLNRGEPEKPLAKIASGGEMSRVMLALKNVVARFEGVPTLIFDEVDANIGGRAASAVARKLQEIAACKQIICITHLAGIARAGNRHVCVDKTVEKGAALTRLKTLTEKERPHELARMLGGDEITQTTLKHAKELLES